MKEKIFEIWDVVRYIITIAVMYGVYFEVELYTFIIIFYIITRIESSHLIERIHGQRLNVHSDSIKAIAVITDKITNIIKK